MKQRSIATKVILFISIVMVAFACMNGFVAYQSIQMTVETTVGRTAIHSAQHIARFIDTEAYEKFLQAPQEDANYWELRAFLNEYREKLDALYVYTIKLDQGTAAIMIDGQPRDSEVASPIGEEAGTSDAELLRTVLQGVGSSSEIVDDPKYGQYLSGFAPITNREGKVIGILGVDISAGEVNEIRKDVILNNLPFMTGLLVLMAIIALSSFAIYIRKRLKPLGELKEIAERIHRGDLRNKITLRDQKKGPKDEVDVLTETFYSMQEDLQRLVSRIKMASAQVATSSEELTANAEESYQVTQQIAVAACHMTMSEEEQLRSIKEITEWIGQLSDVTNHIAVSGEEVNEVTRQATDSTTEGIQTVEDIITQITELNETVESAEKLISALGNRSQEIGTISSMITEIASQTNLLALNAAIESARAGEYGRGFAVVAGEVRLLAERSASSAQQISQLIEIIQKETRNAETFMKRGTDKVRDGLEKTRRVHHVFDSIQKNVGVVSEKVGDFSFSVEQLSQGSNQIMRAVQQLERAAEQIACVSGQNASGAEEQVAAMDEIKSSASSLAQLATEMSMVLEKFKV